MLIPPHPSSGKSTAAEAPSPWPEPSIPKLFNRNLIASSISNSPPTRTTFKRNITMALLCTACRRAALLARPRAAIRPLTTLTTATRLPTTTTTMLATQQQQRTQPLRSIPSSSPRLYSAAAAASASAPSSSSAAAAETPSMTDAEAAIAQLLVDKLSPEEILVQDVSGGCGSMYAIEISAEAFRGQTILKQQRMVNAALGDVVKTWHGVQIRTKVPGQ